MDELDAEYFYLSASNYCKNVGYEGGAKFFLAEAKDEKSHYQRHADYLTGWNTIPALPMIEQPEMAFSSLTDILEKAYGMEFSLCNSYNVRTGKMLSGSFYTTFDHLTKFRKIQKKAVIEYADLLNQIKLIGDNQFGIYYFDKTVLGA